MLTIVCFLLHQINKEKERKKGAHAAWFIIVVSIIRNTHNTSMIAEIYGRDKI